MLDVLRQHEHSDLRVLLLDAPRRVDALRRVGRWHTHVEQHEVGHLALDDVTQLDGVAHTGNHLVAFVREQPGQALAKKGRILGYHDAHGILASTTVGPPRGLCTENCPSSAATRRARPVSPEPVISAPPHPSSTTVTVTT